MVAEIIQNISSVHIIPFQKEKRMTSKSKILKGGEILFFKF